MPLTASPESRSFLSRFRLRKDKDNAEGGSNSRRENSLEVLKTPSDSTFHIDTQSVHRRSTKTSSTSESSTIVLGQPSPALSASAASDGHVTHNSKHLSIPDSRQEKRSSLNRAFQLGPDGSEAKPKDIHKTLLSRSCLRKCLDNPTALHKFGAFLAAELGAEHLVFWLNAQQHANDLGRLLQLSRRIHDMHLPESAPLALNITNDERTDMEAIYQHWMTVQDPFRAAQDRAFDNLLADAWPRFILHRVNLLQKSLMSSKSAGAAALDSFALAEVSNGNDQPLKMLSRGFEELTGYTIPEVVGTNCRFLQGPGTSKSAIARIRTACTLGLPAQEMLLNHRKDGTPYWVLLRIEPLRDFRGELKYLLAHQFNLTRYSTDLGWLLSDAIEEESTSKDSPMVTMQQKRVDVAVNKHLCRQYENPNDNYHPEDADRDQRLKDATALAEADAQSMSQRPRSAHRSRSGTSGSSPTGQAPPSVQLPQSKPPRSARPTSAGAGAPAFGKASSRQERQMISSLAQIEDTEEDAEWQSRAMAHFVFMEPVSGKIRFSSPKLPAEWAAGSCFFTILEKTNPLYMVNNLKKVIKSGKHTEVQAVLHLFKQAERPSSEGRLVSISVTPLLDGSGSVAGVVCLFGV